jgi:hypothetical protein
MTRHECSQNPFYTQVEAPDRPKSNVLMADGGEEDVFGALKKREQLAEIIDEHEGNGV